MSLADIGADFDQGVGLKSSQYEQAVALAMRVHQATGGNVTFVGHSLGGGLAAAAADATYGQAIVFNAAGLNSKYSQGTYRGIRSHIIRGEILSTIQNSWSALGLVMPDTVGTRIYHNAMNSYDSPWARHFISQYTTR